MEEKVILVGVSMSDNDDTEASISELHRLCETAGALPVARIIQNREQVHPATYVGKGKIEEIRKLILETGADGIVCDDELSPQQITNLAEELDTKVMDRTLVILDIFAKHATTSEGKLQVELAQLKYRQSRLRGLGRDMSRLGGGIGTRGPGEKKLETDKRLLSDRIHRLNQEVAHIKEHREVTRSKRKRNNMFVVAIVGYTNAGKSTLLNRLTDATVLEQDILFATLDPTVRQLKLPSGQVILMTDTVGFIRKLPHHLIDAFQSTLEEARYADLILHVADASNKEAEIQMHVVYDTLAKLGIENKPVITVLNKQDQVIFDDRIIDNRAECIIKISAKEGFGIDELISTLEEKRRSVMCYIEKILPYEKTSKLQYFREHGEILEEEYVEDGIKVRGYIFPEYINYIN